MTTKREDVLGDPARVLRNLAAQASADRRYAKPGDSATLATLLLSETAATVGAGIIESLDAILVQMRLAPFQGRRPLE
jgi:hypothetical protein